MHSIYVMKENFFFFLNDCGLPSQTCVLRFVQDFAEASVCHSSLIVPVLCFMNHTTVGPGPRPDPYNRPSVVSFCLKAIKLNGP